MRLLLDTHIVLWRLTGERRLGERAAAALAEATEALYSAVSFAEVGIKARLGKLTMPPDMVSVVRGTGVTILGLQPEHGLALAELPLHHRDPFDRMIIAQARAEGLTIVTADTIFGSYDVAMIDARS